MPFEIIDEIPRRGPGRSQAPAAIRINREKNTVAMNTAALDLLPKANTKVLVAFDHETRQLALVATFDKDPKGLLSTKESIEGGGEKVRRPRALAVGSLPEQLDLPTGTFPVEVGKVGDRTSIITEALPLPESEEQS